MVGPTVTALTIGGMWTVGPLIIGRNVRLLAATTKVTRLGGTWVKRPLIVGLTIGDLHTHGT